MAVGLVFAILYTVRTLCYLIAAQQRKHTCAPQQELMSIADRGHHSSSLSLADGSASDSTTVGTTVDTTVGTTVCHYTTDPQFEALGYKALLYLKYCFQGKAFPSGKAIDSAVLPAVRAQVSIICC